MAELESFEVADGDTFGDLLSADNIRSGEKPKIGLLSAGFFEYWRMYPGTLKETVEKDSGSLEMEVTVPVNSRATVSVPRMGLESVTITEGGKTVWKDDSYAAGVAGMSGGSQSADYVSFVVGSGSYSFKLTGTRKTSGEAR